MTQTAASSSKAIAYAENNLGVHVTYENAVELRDKLDDLYSDLARARIKKRELEARLLDTEMEVAIKERATHPEMSEARMDKHLKQAFHKNTEVRSLKHDILDVTAEVEALEYDVRLVEASIKIETSRLQELSGLLNYLASVKEASTANKARRA